MKDYREEPQTKEKRWEGRIGAQAPESGSPRWMWGLDGLSRTVERNKKTHNSCKFKVLGSYRVILLEMTVLWLGVGCVIGRPSEKTHPPALRSAFAKLPAVQQF